LVLSKKPSWQLISGMERLRRQQPLHLNARIYKTTTTIVISMVIMKISVESYIQRLI